jgi:hypothetical protein
MRTGPRAWSVVPMLFRAGALPRTTNQQDVTHPDNLGNCVAGQFGRLVNVAPGATTLHAAPSSP